MQSLDRTIRLVAMGDRVTIHPPSPQSQIHDRDRYMSIHNSWRSK